MKPLRGRAMAAEPIGESDAAQALHGDVRPAACERYGAENRWNPRRANRAQHRGFTLESGQYCRRASAGDFDCVRLVPAIARAPHHGKSPGTDQRIASIAGNIWPLYPAGPVQGGPPTAVVRTAHPSGQAAITDRTTSHVQATLSPLDEHSLVGETGGKQTTTVPKRVHSVE